MNRLNVQVDKVSKPGMEHCSIRVIRIDLGLFCLAFSSLLIRSFFYSEYLPHRPSGNERKKRPTSVTKLKKCIQNTFEGPRP